MSSPQLSEYELRRESRISRNLKHLQSLGLEQFKVATIKKTKPSTKHRKKETVATSSIPSRPPSTRVVIKPAYAGDFYSDEEEPSTRRKTKRVKVTNPNPRKKERDHSDVPMSDGYDGTEKPIEAKKAFTHFCNATRREIKADLPDFQKKDASLVNSKLKEKWLALQEIEGGTIGWIMEAKKDQSRYNKELALYQKIQDFELLRNLNKVRTTVGEISMGVVKSTEAESDVDVDNLVNDAKK